MPESVMQVTSQWEEHSHVTESRCVCGHSFNPDAWELHRGDGKTLEVCRATCSGCGSSREFWFDVSMLFKPGAPNAFNDLERAWPSIPLGEKYATDRKKLSQQMNALLQRVEAEGLDEQQVRAEISLIHERTIPRLLGRYEVLGMRQGGMSTLYLCRDVRENGRPGFVICKVVQAVDQQCRLALRREAELWLKFGRHRNLVTLYDVGASSDEQVVLVLEPVHPGPAGRNSVRDWLQVDALPANRVLDILRGVVRGMRYCRAVVPSFVHGDLKPENLLLGLGYEVKLTDFGLARSRDIVGPMIGRALGTPGYISPECWSGAEASEASDVYAFGIIAYELLMGHHPFHRAHSEELQFAHENEFVRVQHSLLSEPVSVLLNRCLSKSPSERPTFEELARGLAVDEDLAEVSTNPLLAARDANNRGTALAALGRHAEAIQQYITALMPDSASMLGSPVLVNLAFSLSCSRAFELAEHTYRLALEAERSAHGLANYAAHMLRSRQRDRYNEALALCDEAIALDSDFFVAYVNKAALLNSLGRYAEAVEVGETALQFDPLNPTALLEVAFGLAKLGNRNRAWKLTERILKTHPKFEPALELLRLMREDK